MSNIKKFVGEKAYNIIKNMAVDGEALRAALITPQNARNVFSELSEFEIKSLCTEISNSGTIGQVRKTTRDEIITAFNAAGYDRVIFDDEQAIEDCQKYYARGETICTYGNLAGRMREYHMIVAVKANIDNIKRAENPQREDEYGTSILNIQIARNGSHMSIKNRYNHTVSQPDSTFNNNLDVIHMGLQSMVLGYYGFASLNNQKQYYDSIVNIDGKYLKYHAEKNNIYFGAFTLDGTNGARFTDAGRYYITRGEDRDYYPLVLDFKDKIAIDLTGRNGKTPLVTRALKEGVLSSANKEYANIITMIFHDAKAELLQARKSALRYIADRYGYDFQKPYTVTAFCGKWTANGIIKATGESNGILLVCVNGYVKVCEMNGGKFDAKDLKAGYEYKIDTFYGQGNFEDARKSGTAAAYFITQNKEYRRTVKEICRHYGIDRAEYDKCGNNLTETRRALQQRLRVYKTDKRAGEAKAQDYTADIAEIKACFSGLKARILTMLASAETCADYDRLDDVTNYNLTRLVRDIENITKHAEKKDFASVEQAKSAIFKAKNTISKLQAKLSA